ncbi:MAG: alpha/beta hydrolase [Candidatus Thermoplasmatota archaeon]|nr:alpha/beta hydrolase [Candidatus Thermoplasmatota archaeon]
MIERSAQGDGQIQQSKKPGERIKSALLTGYMLSLHAGLGKVLCSKVRVGDVNSKGSKKSRCYMRGKDSYPLIVLHGLSPKGYNDPRLVHFANNLAICGFEVHTPHLEGMTNLDFRFTDVETLVEMAESISKHKNFGVIGFSAGATYGLILAAQEKVREKIGFVLAAGAYYSLENLLERVLSDPDSDIYARLILSWGARECLDLSGNDANMLEGILGDYCKKEDNFTFEEKSLIERIAKLSAEGLVLDWWWARADQLCKLDLSLSSYLSHIKARVFLMHAAGDQLISAEETLKIHEELTKSGRQVDMNLSTSKGHIAYIGTSPLGVLKIFYNIMLMRDGGS